jgi:hypothetical protein
MVHDMVTGLDLDGAVAARSSRTSRIDHPVRPSIQWLTGKAASMIVT